MSDLKPPPTASPWSIHDTGGLLWIEMKRAGEDLHARKEEFMAFYRNFFKYVDLTKAKEEFIERWNAVSGRLDDCPPYGGERLAAVRTEIFELRSWIDELIERKLMIMNGYLAR